MTPLALGALAATALTLTAAPVLSGAPAHPPLGAPAERGGVEQPSTEHPATEHPAGQAAPSGAFDHGVWPISPPVVVTGFDDPLPYAAGHRGVDLAAPLGTVVVAAGDGTVTTAGLVAGRPVVVVAHTAAGSAGLRTTYLPVRPLVGAGDDVRAGDPIGVVAPPLHCAAESCLHWGARRGDRYIDPRSLLPLAAGPIVLLPLDP